MYGSFLMFRHYIAIFREDARCVVRGAHHVTRHNTPIHNITWTAPQLSISQNALETLLEDGNVIPEHAEATIHNQ